MPIPALPHLDPPPITGAMGPVWLGAQGLAGLARGWWVAGEAALWLLISSHPLPGSWVPGAGRFGQEESGEVIISCLSFSRDV